MARLSSRHSHEANTGEPMSVFTRRWRRVAAGLLAAGVVLLAPAAAGAFAAGEVGFTENGVSATAVNQDGTSDTQAGSHPFAFTTNVSLREGKSEGKSITA